jgi:transposase
VTISPDQLPDEPEALKRIIAAMAQDSITAQAEIAKLRFQLARYRRAEFGRSSERLEREADQLELAIEALEADQAERLAVAPLRWSWQSSRARWRRRSRHGARCRSTCRVRT